MKTNAIQLYHENGTPAFTCLSRTDLPAFQPNLTALLGKILICGCQTKFNVRVQIIRRNNNSYPRSLPGERKKHTDWCQACGDELEDPIQIHESSIHQICDQAFGYAYEKASQIHERRAPFLLNLLREDIAAKLTATIPTDSPIHVWTGLFENRHVSEAQETQGTAVELLVDECLTGERQHWQVVGSVSFRVRTDPFGHTLGGMHAIAGIAIGEGPLTHVHAWPVELTKNGIHPIHSSLERQMAADLDDASLDFLKPPAPNFAEYMPSAHAPLIARMISMKLWPDFFVNLPSGDLLVIEVAGLSDANYRLHGLKKIALYKELEATGFHWVVVRLKNDGFYITHCSQCFAGINRFSDLITRILR